MQSYRFCWASKKICPPFTCWCTQSPGGSSWRQTSPYFLCRASMAVTYFFFFLIVCTWQELIIIHFVPFQFPEVPLHRFYTEEGQLLSFSPPCTFAGILHLSACTKQLWCQWAHSKEDSSWQGILWGCNLCVELPLLLWHIADNHIFVFWWLWVARLALVTTSSQHK